MSRSPSHDRQSGYARILQEDAEYSLHSSIYADNVELQSRAPSKGHGPSQGYPSYHGADLADYARSYNGYEGVPAAQQSYHDGHRGSPTRSHALINPFEPAPTFANTRNDHYAGHKQPIPSLAVYPENRAADGGSTSRRHPNYAPSLRNKLGWWAVIVLIVGCFTTLAVAALLLCLWYLGPSNRLWYSIMANNKAVTTINILAEVLKQAMTLQLGVVTAAIAMLALETASSAKIDAAVLSNARSKISATGVLALVEIQCRRAFTRGINSWTLMLALILTLGLLSISQAVSIILLSDVDLASLPGFNDTTTPHYGFNYYNISAKIDAYVATLDDVSRIRPPSSSTWLLKPPLYPTFAEFSGPPYVEEGVADTGRTLRAFLPYSAQSAPQSLHSYHGPSTVLDARVTRQAPALTNARLDQATLNLLTGSMLSGNVSASKQTPRLDNSTLSPYQSKPGTDSSTSFACYIPPSPTAYEAWNLSTIRDDQWRLSICNLWFDYTYAGFSTAGRLVSESESMPLPPLSNDPEQAYDDARLSKTSKGVPYLVVNLTRPLQSREFELDYDHPFTTNVTTASRGEWLDLTIWAPPSSLTVLADGNVVLPAPMRISVSLCYTAFTAVDMEVNIGGEGNRSEPVPRFVVSQPGNVASYESIRNTLGHNKSKTMQERGVLRLHDRDWIAKPSQFSLQAMPLYFRAFASMMTPELRQVGSNPDGGGRGTDPLRRYPLDKWLQAPNVTMLMWLVGEDAAVADAPKTVLSNFTEFPFFSANTDLIWLFQEILSTGGSIAFALQSMITVLSSMAFYDQIQQFDKAGEAQGSHFITVNRPVRSIGLIIVLAALATHLFFVAYITAIFLSRTQYTMLGQTWHALSQVVSPDTQRVLDLAPTKRDGQLEKQMRAEAKEPLVLRYVPGLGRAAIVRADNRFD